MLRSLVAGVGAALALFHVWLFAGQVWDGALFEPGRLVRWVVAAALITAFVTLRRNSISIFRGRRAVSVWLLAALLHGPAFAQRLDSADDSALRQALATLTQVAFASAACVLALSVWLIVRRRLSIGVRAVSLAPGSLRVGAQAAHRFPLAAPRPPPVA